MDNRAIKLLEEKIYIIKNLILNAKEISEENKYKRISELEALETEINELKCNKESQKNTNMLDI